MNCLVSTEQIEDSLALGSSVAVAIGCGAAEARWRMSQPLLRLVSNM